MVSREDELEQLIIMHKKAYYDGEPLISDSAYDLLEDELRKINPEHPALHLVGSPDGGKIIHSPPMLSCKKATAVEDVVKWFNESNGADLYFGYKIDGLSLSIVYENGKLRQAATRGNGQKGDDVTYAVYYIDDIPKEIPDMRRINVRGEVFMLLSEFNRLKAIIPDITSPRNFASGTLKQKDTTVLKQRKLSFMVWGLEGYNDDLSIHEHMKVVKQWGFKTADIELLQNVTEKMITDYFDKIIDERDELDFEIDGIVFKYNEALDRKNAGYTEHHPKWQIALKFKSQGALTIIRGITWQVGRTGVLTPVAEVEPVKIAGATIQRSTLHNADFVEALGVAIGDEVYIERSGDVIPKIIEVTDKGENEVKLIDKCPSCGSQTKREGVNLICTGIACKDRDLRSIEYWVDTVEIKGLGPKSLNTLFDMGLVTHFADLYSDELTEEILIDTLGVNGKKIYNNINKSRKLPFAVFLAALGIQQLGKALGKELARNFSSLDELQNSSTEKLTLIEGISDLTAQYILQGINDIELTDRILLHNFSIDYSENNVAETEKREVLGKTYVTGKIPGLTKNEIQEKVESLGFEWSKSVSKNLSFLIAGDKPGGSKIDKALLAGVEILTWKEFLEKYDQP